MPRERGKTSNAKHISSSPPGRVGGSKVHPSRRRLTQPRRAERPQDAVPKLDERIVEETDQTVPVAPEKPSPKPRRPTVEPAIDHRKQIVGTDELRRPKRASRAQ